MTDRIAAAFVPLVDCAVLVAAREQGFAAAEGIDLELVKEPSWASLRDHLNLGYVDCAHALAPLPIASTLGVGHVQVDCIVPFVLGRGGNAITVSTQLFSEMQDAAHGAALDSPTAAGKALASAVAKRARAADARHGRFRFSSHNFDLRYWLAAFGVHPDRDVRLVAIPPPLMVESLRAGHVDGFCVGEPWNSLAVARRARPNRRDEVAAHAARRRESARRARAGRTGRGAARQAPARARGRRRMGRRSRESRGARARARLARAISTCLPICSRPSLRGRPALGGGRVADDPSFIYFHKHAANVPRARGCAVDLCADAALGTLAAERRGAIGGGERISC